jgi:hypothetical protein
MRARAGRRKKEASRTTVHPKRRGSRQLRRQRHRLQRDQIERQALLGRFRASFIPESVLAVSEEDSDNAAKSSRDEAGTRRPNRLASRYAPAVAERSRVQAPLRCQLPACLRQWAHHGQQGMAKLPREPNCHETQYAVSSVGSGALPEITACQVGPSACRTNPGQLSFDEGQRPSHGPRCDHQYDRGREQ